MVVFWYACRVRADRAGFDTWLKTEKFLAGIPGKRPEQEKLLAEKALENTQRRSRSEITIR